MTSGLPARDLVDVRLAAAIDQGGCAVCVVRARAERGMLDSIIAERVLDLGFREGLEREHGFCRRHAAALIVADRRSTGILGSSILYEAILRRRLATIKEALETRGRRRKRRLEAAVRRPPCLVCGEGVQAVDIAAARLAARTADPAWAAAAAAIPFCLDDLVVVLAAIGDGPAATPVFEAQLARLEDLRARLEGFADHSAQDRRQLMTDAERAAADEAAAVLGGTGDRPRA